MAKRQGARSIRINKQVQILTEDARSSLCDGDGWFLASATKNGDVQPYPGQRDLSLLACGAE